MYFLRFLGPLFGAILSRVGAWLMLGTFTALVTRPNPEELARRKRKVSGAIFLSLLLILLLILLVKRIMA